MGDGSVNLPPGFHFCPTDEELVLHFLLRKASLLPCHPDIIPDLDLCLHDPWEFNGKALTSGSVYYFFSNKVTENWITKNGYWMESGIIDEPIVTSAGNKVGIKKYLVFYIGEAPGGVETDWIMQEYHLCNHDLRGALHNRRGKRKIDCSKWVLCRVYERKGNFAQWFCISDDEDNGTELSSPDEMFLSAVDDEFDDTSFPK
ncbi:NAC domain-containing protein 104 [Quercus suber]|nr:NAC domain-containing protein 104-like [Quercus suber]POE55106.1 nac domain-containing protein 104 [Quercus suber]